MFLRNSTRIHRLENEVFLLQKQMTALCDHLGIAPNPPRRWERHSSPISHTGSLETGPTSALPAIHFEPSIDRITIDQHLFVRVYSNGHRIDDFSGHISKVSEPLKIRAPHIRKWEQVVTRGARPLTDPETPIPELQRNLV